MPGVKQQNDNEQKPTRAKSNKEGAHKVITDEKVTNVVLSG